MLRKSCVFLVIATLSTVGCARLTTYNKEINLETGSVAIDAKQRVVYSHKRKVKLTDGAGGNTEEIVITCAEPSPDALAVLGANGALSASNPTGVGGSASGAFAEAAASIGLRTQSIQLLRDLNYRICESYSNDAISRTETAGLLRRGQSTMMGLIAIEQLTGPVVASQVALNARASGGTGPASSSDIATAKADVVSKKEAVLTAESNLDTARTAHKANTDKISDLQDKKQAELDKDEAKQDKALLQSLSDSIKATEAAAATSGDALTDKSRRVREAQKDLSDAEGQLAKLQNGSTTASAQTQTEIEAAAARQNAATKTLVDGVSGIVKEINRSYFTDSCFSIMSDLVRQPTLIAQMNAVPAVTATNEAVEILPILKTALQACSTFLGEEKSRLTTK